MSREIAAREDAKAHLEHFASLSAIFEATAALYNQSTLTSLQFVERTERA